MKALVVLQGNRVEVKDHPVPVVGDSDILVKTVAVAQNPTDWKFVDSGRANVGSISGCDWSGYVVKTGKDVTSPRVGQHVAGFVMGSTFADSGAYAEYVRTPAELSWVVPDGTLSHEEAATMGCAFWTAVQALFHPNRLDLVEPPAKVSHDEWVYIHGGSSSVGQFAIQLAALAGYKVVTTASPRNFELVTSLGASAVFDYKDPDVVDKVKAATGDSIRPAFDTISSAESQAISAAVIAPTGGKVMHVLAVHPEATSRTDVERSFTIIYSSLGRAYTYATGQHSPAVPEDRVHMAQFLKKVPQIVKDGKIKPLPVKLWEGGLAAIPDGFQFMKEGKVSAEKLVYRV
ncbi:GroES-like protein [Lentinus tigrinus ALCF2SS1-7]|uniref:GroES-like protein n=1 Tax=Lentinus tigrinus ALCF2SS1-6 TaxID=1328759 RepID=A0A5C2STF3_9APHY|nr:GroES-like protein [Lentinus tigrinus ALCF2SS1-6]RPD80510.1 GroES-like protein [Lentinus tigrinus ALCF2SS1-7]